MFTECPEFASSEGGCSGPTALFFSSVQSSFNEASIVLQEIVLPERFERILLVFEAVRPQKQFCGFWVFRKDVSKR
jgi:hypothetical protein